MADIAWTLNDIEWTEIATSIMDNEQTFNRHSMVMIPQVYRTLREQSGTFFLIALSSRYVSNPLQKRDEIYYIRGSCFAPVLFILRRSGSFKMLTTSYYMLQNCIAANSRNISMLVRS